MRNKMVLWFGLTVFTLMSSSVNAGQWKKIDTEESLKEMFNNVTVRGFSVPQKNFELNKVQTDWQIEYCHDGTGILTFMGQTYPRKWVIKGNDHVCITSDYGERCYYYEQHIKYGSLYRSGLVGSRKTPWSFTISKTKSEICK